MGKIIITTFSLLLLACVIHAQQFTNILIDDIFGPNEPSIAINPLNPNELVAGSNNQNVYRSSDGGLTWTNDFLISTEGVNGDPCLLCDSLGNFFYFHLSTDIDKIVCQKSTNAGVLFSNGSYAWNNNILTQDKEWATVDMHSNNLYVTWTEYDNGPNPGLQDSSRIYFSKSTDNGLTFSNPVKINEHDGDCLYLDITDAHPFVGVNGEIYVSFMDSVGIHINKSTDEGITWLPSPPVIDSFGQFRYDTVPFVTRVRAMPYGACDRSNGMYRGNVYLSWCDHRNGLTNSDVFFIKSTDGGNSWSNVTKVNSDNTTLHQYRNSMCVDQVTGYIYIVYHDRRNYPGNDTTDIYMARSIDGGNTWTDFKLSNNGFINDGSVFDGDYIDICAHNGIVRPIWTGISNMSSAEIWTCLYNEPLLNLNEFQGRSEPTFSINPNPAINLAAISFTNEIHNTQITFTDISGRIVKSFRMNNERERVIDIRDLTAGSYFVRSGNNTKMLVVRK
jgi:hypothetical protein